MTSDFASRSIKIIRAQPVHALRPANSGNPWSAVEQGSGFGGAAYAGPGGAFVTTHSSGASAPLKAFQRKFGLTPEHVINAAERQIGLAANRPPPAVREPGDRK